MPRSSWLAALGLAALTLAGCGDGAPHVQRSANPSPTERGAERFLTAHAGGMKEETFADPESITEDVSCLRREGSSRTFKCRVHFSGAQAPTTHELEVLGSERGGHFLIEKCRDVNPALPELRDCRAEWE